MVFFVSLHHLFSLCSLSLSLFLSPSLPLPQTHELGRVIKEKQEGYWCKITVKNQFLAKVSLIHGGFKPRFKRKIDFVHFVHCKTKWHKLGVKFILSTVAARLVHPTPFQTPSSTFYCNSCCVWTFSDFVICYYHYQKIYNQLNLI